MVDVKTINDILLGIGSLTMAGTIGFFIYAVDSIVYKPERVFEKVKAQYSDSIGFDEAKKLYTKLIKAFSWRATIDPKRVISNEQKSFFEKLEEKINPQIEKEIQGAEITPRTTLKDISKTYKEVSPHSYK